MRVLITVDSLASDLGGPSRSVPELCRALRGLGVTVDLFVRQVSTIPPRLKSEVNVICPTGYRGPSVTLPALQLGRIIGSQARNTDDIIHDNGTWLFSNHVSASVARRLSVPWLVSPRGMLSEWSLQQKKWKKKLAWHLYQRRDFAHAAAFHVTSDLEANDIRSRGFRNPVANIPNGVALPPRYLLASARPEGRKVALFLSRLHPKKGALDLVLAWSKVRPYGWRLDIVGPDEGGHRLELEAAVERLSLKGEVRLLGPVSDDDKWAVYRGADLFVLPTHTENFGIVIAEALASGVPVITTRRAPWSALIDYNCGWWIEPSIDDLVHALKRATDLSSKELAGMGARGRKYVESNFSWERVGAQMVQLYQWVGGNGQMPDFVDA